MSFVLHYGDCLDPVSGLVSLADRSITHTICDPPYSKDLYSRTRTNKGSGIRKNGRPYARTEGHERMSAMQLANNAIGSIDDILEGVAAQILRVTQRWIIVFCDFEIAYRWQQAFGNAYVRTGAWVKTDPMPQVTGDRPGAGFEPCVIAHSPGRKRWNGGGRAGVWIGGTSKGDERPDHPCPKPEWLMERLVSDFTNRDDLILDPFSGSGTTGVAALRLGRRFIGWERDEKFHAAATKRLAATREQLEMFRSAK